MSFVYDALNRIVEAHTLDRGSQPDSTLSYLFDAVGNRKQLIDSEGGTTAYEHDAAGRLAEIHPPAGGVLRLLRDPAGRLSELRYPSGVTSAYEYDNRGRLGSIVHTDPQDQVLASFQYGYDLRGDVRSIVEPDRSRIFTRDALRRLIRVADTAGGESYSYDAAGNRLTSHHSGVHTYNDADRLLENDRFSFSYDENGSRTGKTEKATGITTAYTYNSAGQLQRIEVSGGEVIEVAYDALGRRIENVKDGIPTSYVYDGASILHEHVGNNRDFAARYTFGNRRTPLSMERLDVSRLVPGTLFEVLVDGVGTVQIVTDSNNGESTLAVSNLFDSFGNRLSSLADVSILFSFEGGIEVQADEIIDDGNGLRSMPDDQSLVNTVVVDEYDGEYAFQATVGEQDLVTPVVLASIDRRNALRDAAVLLLPQLREQERVFRIEVSDRGRELDQEIRYPLGIPKAFFYFVPPLELWIASEARRLDEAELKLKSVERIITDLENCSFTLSRHRQEELLQRYYEIAGYPEIDSVISELDGIVLPN